MIICDMWDAHTCKAAARRVVIPNFNDNYKDKAPDIGAHERETQRMRFGTSLYKSWPPAGQAEAK